MRHPLTKLIKLQKSGEAVGIYSACSANEYVLKACMKRALQTNTVLLIEATSNQVDQYGGYTGMKPVDFKNFVQQLALEVGLDFNKVVLGGDHLGPLTFTHLNEKEAMVEANELIRQYVLAGFTKIHIDTSMKVNDDAKDEMLQTEVIARRGAEMAKTATLAYQELLLINPDAMHPVYVVGSEVPIPGGAQEVEEELQVTKVEDCNNTINAFKQAFLKLDLQDAWDNVIGLVVQPGVEFGDESVDEYNREKASELTKSLDNIDNIIFEGHSTDYQTKISLKEMVEDGIGILKVGPGLTFALREGLFALAHIENAMYLNTDTKLSNLIEVLEEEMLTNPKNWQKHYHGTEDKLAFKRKYSFSDRMRYYLPATNVQKALDLLFANLDDKTIPYSLLSAYMPIQYTKVRERQLENNAKELLMDRVVNCVDEYLYATQQQKLN